MSRPAINPSPELWPAGALDVDVERRKHHRYRTLDYVARLDSRALQVPVRVTNLSSGGALITGSTFPDVGEHIRLYFDCTQSIEGRVSWTSKGQAGIRFVKEIACEQFVRDLVDSRLNATTRMLRFPVRIRVWIQCGAASLVTFVDNISQKGLRVAHDGGLVPGAQVEITLPGGIHQAGTIRWVNARSAGIELVGKLAVADLEVLVTRRLHASDPANLELAPPVSSKKKLPRQIR